MDAFKINFHASALFSLAVPIRSIIFQPHKTKWCDWAHPTLDFSLVLRGTGHLYIRDRHWRLQAPCLFIQLPQIPLRYGPDKEWEEISFTYDAKYVSAFKHAGLLHPYQPVWVVHHPERLYHLFALFHSYIQNHNEAGARDRLNCLCEMILQECRLASLDAEPTNKQEAIIRKIQSDLNIHYLDNPDMQELARRHGLSPANFRRLWSRFFDSPPFHYVMQLRIQEACRLLAENRQSIKEIAFALKFSDSLYFSKKFRQYTGQSPSSFRAAHFISPSISEKLTNQNQT